MRCHPVMTPCAMRCHPEPPGVTQVPGDGAGPNASSDSTSPWAHGQGQVASVGHEPRAQAGTKKNSGAACPRCASGLLPVLCPCQQGHRCRGRRGRAHGAALGSFGCCSRQRCCRPCLLLGFPCENPLPQHEHPRDVPFGSHQANCPFCSHTQGPIARREQSPAQPWCHRGARSANLRVLTAVTDSSHHTQDSPWTAAAPCPGRQRASPSRGERLRAPPGCHCSICCPTCAPAAPTLRFPAKNDFLDG